MKGLKERSQRGWKAVGEWERSEINLASCIPH